MLYFACPHTTTYVTSYYNVCPHTTIYASSYYCMRVLILLYINCEVTKYMQKETKHIQKETALENLYH